MIGLLVNETSRPDGEVRGILEYALEQIGGLDHGRLAVKVRECLLERAGGGVAYREGEAPRWAGRHRYAISVSIPRPDDEDGAYGHPIVCWHARGARDLAIAKGAETVYETLAIAYERGERRFGRWPIYVANDWREFLVHLATHELAHVLAQDRDRKRGSHSEVECELLAERVLNQWRLDNPTEPEGGSMEETIDLVKLGRGTVWHIVASANETDRVKSYLAYCGIEGEAAGPERDIDARAVRHRGANVCANCRNQLTLKNPTEGGTPVSSITDDLQEQAGKAAAGGKTPETPTGKGKGGTATATAQKPSTRGGKGKTKLSAIAAAEQILRKEGKPLHVKQITERIQAMPETKLGGKTPDATVGAILAVASKKPGSVFRRTKPGTYAIRKGK